MVGGNRPSTIFKGDINMENVLEFLRHEINCLKMEQEHELKYIADMENGLVSLEQKINEIKWSISEFIRIKDRYLYNVSNTNDYSSSVINERIQDLESAKHDKIKEKENLDLKLRRKRDEYRHLAMKIIQLEKLVKEISS